MERGSLERQPPTCSSALCRERSASKEAAEVLRPYLRAEAAEQQQTAAAGAAAAAPAESAATAAASPPAPLAAGDADAAVASEAGGQAAPATERADQPEGVAGGDGCRELAAVKLGCNGLMLLKPQGVAAIVQH